LIYFLSALGAPNVLNRKALAGMPTSSPSWHFGVHQWGFNVFVIEPPSRRSAIHPAIQVDDSVYWMLSQQRQPTALWLVLCNGLTVKT
jgi:hypothetical protein